MPRAELRELSSYVFGSTAAVMTNVSLIAGLESAHASRAVILSGLLTIALADNVSDSLGIRLHEETEGKEPGDSLLSTVLNFAGRLLLSLTFVAFVLLLLIREAIIASVVWALCILNVVSYLISRKNGHNSLMETAGRVLTAVVLVVFSRLLGDLIATRF